MSQLHIHASAGDVAPFVLLPGDPKRAAFIAETFLEAPERYNDNRGLLGFTGTYKGARVSVQTSGMGCPSLAIVAEELARLGAKRMVRVGTSGIISKHVKPTELVLATGAVPLDGTTRQYLQGEPYAPVPSFDLTRALADAARAAGATCHAGLIQTEDAFYATTLDDVAKLEARGILAVEMEAAALFLIGKLRQVNTACLLVASNYIGDSSFVAPEKLQGGVETMVKVALEAATILEVTA